MSTPSLRINRFVPLLLAATLPGAAPGASSLPVSALVCLCLGGPLVVGAALASFARRRRRRLAIVARGHAQGLSTASAELLARLLGREGPDALDVLLEQPAELRRLCARALRAARDEAAAERLAVAAARLFAERGAAAPAFPGAPVPFDRLRLHDPTDARTPDVIAWVLSADERSLQLIARDDCPWPARRVLRVAPAAAPTDAAASFEAQLMMRPAYPAWEWVLMHRQVDVVTNRRATARVPCRLATLVLPDGGDAPRLRERLLREESLEADELHRAECFARRNDATVLDLSPDGARLSLRHAVTLRQRLHLLLRQPGGAIVALPLCEVVSTGQEDDGSVRAGTRFVNLRLKERVRVAEFVRTLERQRVGAAKS
ncbi:MAG TPA: PilZ domain-containing protein [Planctomycetota bacterium]|nr:PilZ domain-containing protein [Planctomycetota bacterium]